MRLLRPLTLAAAVALAAPLGHSRAAGPLVALKWKARPIVIFSDTRDDPRVGRQIAALDRTKPALAARDVVVLCESRPDNALRQHLGVTERGFAVVLVGKDGDVKKVWRRVVDPEQIFGLIDQMPMRREEMRRTP